MANLGPLAAEIGPVVWGTPANFNRFRVLAALLHGTLIVGVSQTLRHWTEGATYIQQGGHHVGHWPTFLVFKSYRLHTHAHTQLTDCCTWPLKWWVNIIKFHSSLPSCQPRLAQWTHSHWPWQTQQYGTAPVSFHHKTPTEHYWPIAASNQHAVTATWQSNSTLLAACHQCTRRSVHDWHFWILAASDRMDLHIKQAVDNVTDLS